MEKMDTYLSKMHNPSNNVECGKCGFKHGEQCPATGKKCNSCGKENHFA